MNKVSAGNLESIERVDLETLPIFSQDAFGRKTFVVACGASILKMVFFLQYYENWKLCC
jgi:hypothetical protein